MRLGAACDFSVPGEESNYRNLVWEIGWYGIALAATTRFLSVYAIRLGATPLELGLISSLPPLILVFSAFFGGWWISRHKDSTRALKWPGLMMRLPFLLPAFAPLLPMQWQPLWLVVAVALPAIAQGVSGVVFTVLVRQGIGDTNMTPLLGHRSLALNVGIALGALIFGIWLEAAPFPGNYQTMFVVAYALSLISSWHLLKIRPLAPTAPVATMATDAPPPRPAGISPWRSPKFRAVAAVIVLSHVSFTSLISIIPLRLVNELHADEGFMAISALSELIAGALVALVAHHLVRALGNRAVIAVTLVGTALAALVLALATSLPLTLLGTALSGGAWTAAGIGVFGFFVQSTPHDEFTSYSTAYMQAIGLSLFAGPMIGSILVQGGMPVVQVILLGAVLRLVAAALIEQSRFYRGRRRRRPVAGVAVSAGK